MKREGWLWQAKTGRTGEIHQNLGINENQL